MTPRDEEVGKVLQQYIEGLQALFDKYKVRVCVRVLGGGDCIVHHCGNPFEPSQRLKLHLVAHCCRCRQDKYDPDRKEELIVI